MQKHKDMEDKLKAFVEQRRMERIARQEARIKSLRDLNLKKYNKPTKEEIHKHSIKMGNKITGTVGKTIISKPMTANSSSIPSKQGSCNKTKKSCSVKPLQSKTQNCTINKNIQSKVDNRRPSMVCGLSQDFIKPQTKREPLTEIPPVRRSISAIFRKKIPISELPNCYSPKRWNSAKSLYHNDVSKPDIFGTPEPSELRRRLLEWLNKRGKSLTSYHHLQCFGLHHLNNIEKTHNRNTSQYREEKFDDDDEDKENFPEPDNFVTASWREDSASRAHNVNELLIGALQDLMQLSRDGFDPDQGRHWLRAISDQFPFITETSLFWECRASLTGCQELKVDNDCVDHERTPVKTPSVMRLMEKFSHLKITSSAEKTLKTPKHVDVKNAFSSTLIKFAVHQSKSNNSEFIVTPVRRSNRLSTIPASPASSKTPLMQICSSIQHIDLSLANKTVFITNKKIPPAP